MKAHIEVETTGTHHGIRYALRLNGQLVAESSSQISIEGYKKLLLKVLKILGIEPS